MKLRDVLAVIDDNETVSVSFDYKSLKSCGKLRREHLIDLLDMTVKRVKTLNAVYHRRINHYK